LSLHVEIANGVLDAYRGPRRSDFAPNSRRSSMGHRWRCRWRRPLPILRTLRGAYAERMTNWGGRW